MNAGAALAAALTMLVIPIDARAECPTRAELVESHAPSKLNEWMGALFFEGPLDDPSLLILFVRKNWTGQLFRSEAGHRFCQSGELTRYETITIGREITGARYGDQP